MARPATLGEVLRQERRAKSLSLRKLAERTGIHETSLNDYELGNSMPDHSTLARIIEGLGVPAEPILATIYPVGEREQDWDIALMRKLIAQGASEDEAAKFVDGMRVIVDRRVA